VDARRIDRAFETSLQRVSPIPQPAGGFPVFVTTGASPARPSAQARATAFLLPHEWNSSARAVNRLLKDPSTEVLWADATFAVDGVEYPAGTIVARNSSRGFADRIGQIGQETGVQVIPVSGQLAVSGTRLRAPRIGLYQPWTGLMDEGWTRWLLEQYEFPYTTLHNADIQASNLREKFDVILFADQSKTSMLNGNRGEWIRPEYRGGIGARGSRAIEQFVRAGGTVVTLGAAADFAIDELGLPVRNVLRGVPRDQFYCPGAVLEIFVDNQHPLGYGMPPRTSAYFRDNPAFELTAPFTTSAARAVAKYPSTNPLQSGWIGGSDHLYDRAGAVEVTYGNGRVVLLGFAAQFRAQPHATFKLLFNAIHWSATTKP